MSAVTLTAFRSLLRQKAKPASTPLVPRSRSTKSSIRPEAMPPKVEKPPKQLFWYAGHMREGLMQLDKGDQVYIRPYYVKLAVGKCWYVMSTKRNMLYVVAEEYGGARMNQLVRLITDEEGSLMQNPPGQLKRMESWLEALKKQYPVFRSPVTNAPF